jgi:NAD(P)-dependent dehydrogenase (short-subunit alcohol dehydrogenase family)
MPPGTFKDDKMKKTVLITGASGNLGKATVLKFISEGYKVIATVSPGKSLGYSVDGEIHEYEADLTNESSADSAIKEIITGHSNLDAGLLLVGGFAAGNIGKTNGDALKKMFSVNFDTAYYVARPLFNHMLTQADGGKLIFVGARPALNPKDGRHSVGYSLSKSLIFKLAEILNAEGASKNVVASVIVPSTIDTDANRKAMPEKDFTSWVKPEDIADAMAFLCTRSAAPFRETVLKIYNRA